MYKTEEELEIMQAEYDSGTLLSTPKEKLVINPKVAYYVSETDIKKSIPHEHIMKLGSEYGKLTKLSLQDPVGNLLWDFLYFRDISYFRPAAIAFEESQKAVKGTNLSPAYTRLIPNTKAWNDFWIEEGKRIKNGYEPIVDGKPCGLRISGEFYFYLNYGWMKYVEFFEDGTYRDTEGFPRFLAVDYFYYKELEARENPNMYNLPLEYKKPMAVTKGRRMGYSYKAGAGAVWVTAFRNKARVLIASAEGKDAALCFKKAMMVIDHLSKYTPFGREELGLAKNNGGWVHEPVIDNETEGRFAFTRRNTRTGERAGRQSVILTASLYNKPDAASGEGISRLYIEESGKINDLQEVWNFSRESLRVGEIYRDGIAIIFGTGGEMVASSGKAGSSRDFSLLFNKPSSYNLAEFDNIYEYRDVNTKCGFFVSSMWTRFGASIVLDNKRYRALDDKGNAFFWVADLTINKERVLAGPPIGTKENFEKFITQVCKTPSEAFLITSGSRFQSDDLFQRQTDISTSRIGFEGMRVCGELVEHNNGIEFIPMPDLQPIVTSSFDTNNREGCLIQYESPIKVNGRILDDAYIISCDPIGINTDGGKSLVAIIVYKTNRYVSWMGEEKIVATYYGRKKINPVDYMLRLLLKLSKYYNAKITFETDRDPGIFSYFLKNNELNRLMMTPVLTMNKFIGNSKTSLRQYGHSCASASHKTLGENLIYEWLDRRGSRSTYYDTENGEKYVEEGVRNLDRLQDQLLIEQLINYSRDGNYDAVSALMGIMFQLKEWYDEPEDIPEETVSGRLKSWYKNKYKGKYEFKE